MAEKVVTGIEPVIRVLQTHALPLGYTTMKRFTTLMIIKKNSNFFKQLEVIK